AACAGVAGARLRRRRPRHRSSATRGGGAARSSAASCAGLEVDRRLGNRSHRRVAIPFRRAGAVQDLAALAVVEPAPYAVLDAMTQGIGEALPPDRAIATNAL